MNSSSQEEETNNNDEEATETISRVQENYYRQQNNQKNQIRVLVAMAYGLKGYNYLEDWAVPNNYRKLLYPTTDHILDEFDRRFHEMPDVFKPPRSGLNRQQAIKFLKKYPIENEADVGFLKGKLDCIEHVIQATRRPRNSEHAWEILVQGLNDGEASPNLGPERGTEETVIVESGGDEGESPGGSRSEARGEANEVAEVVSENVRETAAALLHLFRSPQH